MTKEMCCLHVYTNVLYASGDRREARGRPFLRAIPSSAGGGVLDWASSYATGQDPLATLQGG